MDIRFEVNQAEAFRRGIDVPKSIVTIQVNPAEIPESERHLIADRLDGIDVMLLRFSAGEISQSSHRLIAKSPDYQGLIEAVKANELDIQADRLRAIAQSRATLKPAAK